MRYMCEYDLPTEESRAPLYAYWLENNASSSYCRVDGMLEQADFVVKSMYWTLHAQSLV